MRTLVVDTYYPAFLRSQYAAAPGLAARPYAEQLQSLIECSFGTSDAYSRHLRRLGGDAADVIANCEPLQRRWLAEHGIGRPRGARLADLAPAALAGAAHRRWLQRALAAQVADFAPDVLYVQDPWFVDARTLDLARRGGAMVATQIASPPPPPARLRHYDLILTSFPHYVERFRALGLASEYLRIGFDETVMDRLARRSLAVAPGAERRFAASFVGGLDPRVHAAGTTVLEHACREADVDVWGYGAAALPPHSPILRRYHGEAWGLDMYAVLARSRIAINRHVDAAEGHANNMRLYEATGAGALLLTDAGCNLPDLFEPGREVVVYDSADDLGEKLHHYLGHDDERRLIAAAGQARTLAEHTYADRIIELGAILANHLARRRRASAAPAALGPSAA